MLAALRGEPTDALPWAPRLDLWYNAHRRRGTLPAGYEEASLMEITDSLGAGFHAVIPHFRDLRSPDDDVHRALGIYNLQSMPYRTILEGTTWERRNEGDVTSVTYHTPRGSITTRVLYDDGMRSAGISITHILEHAIRQPADYAVVEYIFDHARVEPNEDGYARYRAAVGDRGLAVAFLSLAGSPMHLLQRELMSMEHFFYELYDHPEKLETCARAIGAYFERVLEAVTDSSAETFLLGANYDAGVTLPPYFRTHILPWLQKAARGVHREGKFLLTHTDGENTGLLDLYLESAIDIADSVCPLPMTRLTLRQVREAFGGKITVMGGIPSVTLLRQSMSDSTFRAFLDQFFTDLGCGDHLILGISDTTPPDAAWDRLQLIGEYVRAFGEVRPTD